MPKAPAAALAMALLFCAPAATAQRAHPPSGTAEALTHYERGRAFYASGRYRLAAAELERAVRLDPTGTNLLFNLGTIYERMGEIGRAHAAFTTYLTLTHDDAEADRTRRILTRLDGAAVELRALHRRRGRADAAFFLSTGAALLSTALGVAWLATDDRATPDPVPVGLTVGGVSLGIFAAVLYFAREAPAPRAFYAPD
ncbi:MAG: tetratricopeptide repeat protein [Myxococcales bacterium]|nr:tetratricopeptide repeat protein [Myxococcales bacterium]